MIKGFYMLNLLFESGEILKRKAKEIEEMNIRTLQETNREIQALLKEVHRSSKQKVIHVHDTSAMSPFPVDHRISK